MGLPKIMRDVRSMFGCDKHTEQVTYGITCPRCNGSRYLDLPDDRGVVACDRCRGEGDVTIHRCPASHQTADIRPALRAYARYRQGFLPVEGGVQDQSPQFMALCSVLDDEIAAHQNEIRERAAAAAKRKAGR